MRRAWLFVVFLPLLGCNLREKLDIGSAKAIKELQKAHNELLPVVQQNTATDAKLATILTQEHPDNLPLKEVVKAQERTAERAAQLAKVERDPYASLSQFGVLIERINWLFSDEGLLMLATLIGGMGDMGGMAKIIQLKNRVKQAHKTDPNKPLD